MSSRPVWAERRRNATMFSKALSTSIHSKPTDSPSSSQSAFSGPYTSFRSRTNFCTPACSGSSIRGQSKLSVSVHSRHCPNSPPMNKSFFPGCAHMYAYSARRVANFCSVVPGILLSSDHFIMRERQDKVFTPRVHETKRERVMITGTEKRICLKVFERVVHPTHIPLEIKTESAVVNRTTPHRPRS